MAKKPVKKNVEAKSQVTNWSQKRKGDQPKAEDTVTEVVETRVFPEGVEPALVSFSGGLTLSLGNFEFVRIDASLTMPCLPEEVDSMFERCKKFVENKVNEEKDKIKGL